MVKMIAIGHLGQDARVSENNGQFVINFSIASTERWKSANGEVQEKTTWVECSYWNKSGAIAQYLKKGTQVYVEGTASVKQWEGKDGTANATLSLRTVVVQLLGSKEQSGSRSGAEEMTGSTSGSNVGGGSNSNGRSSNGTGANQAIGTTKSSQIEDAVPVDDDLPF